MTAVHEADRLARLVLSRLAEPGDAEICLAVAASDASDVLRKLLAGEDGQQQKKKDLTERMRAADPELDLEKARRQDARFVIPGDDEWPPRLVDLTFGPEKDRRGGPPLGLWVRGSGSLADLTERSVSIVGARAASAYGEFVAADLAADCADAGFTVISGGAYGIDAAAHRGALGLRRPTIAVLAGGVDMFYPPRNTDLLKLVAKEGLIVSEAAPGCAPSKSRFLSRNRLIAALPSGIVVVEAAIRSGSLNTARWARDLGRPVMGVPGPVTSAVSAGVHQLLRQPETLLVTDGAEVVEQLSPIGQGLAPVKSGPVLPWDSLDPRTKQVLEAVPKLRAASPQAIARTAGLPSDEVNTRLRMLPELVQQTDEGWRLRET